MTWNSVTLIVLVLVLVLCRGPMLWMMMRGNGHDGDRKHDHPNDGSKP